MGFKRILIVGLGYIGLPTAAMFASKKFEVIGVDVNAKVVETINAGRIHIVEPGLEMLVHTAVKDGCLRASLKAEAADAFIIAVPTPFKGDHEPDLSYVQSAAELIAPVLAKGNLIVLESTSPVGTTEKLTDWLALARPDLSFPQSAGEQADINVAYCPERVLPGHVVRELVENDRVIGGMTGPCSHRSIELYRAFVKGECVITNARTAEMAKLTENASRDVGIAFANELSLICDQLDINVWELIELANRHPRVNILQPGPGVGGHCIAVDPWFIVSSAPNESKLIHVARQINESKPDWVFQRVRSELSKFLMENPDRSAETVTIACLGLAFKADIDDLRESPAVNITKQIVAELPCRVAVAEPNIKELPSAFEGLVKFLDTHSAINTADIVVVLVDHKVFKVVDRDHLVGKVVIDTRGIWR